MKPFTEEKILGIFDHATSGITRYMEAIGQTTPPPKEELPPTPDQMDATPDEPKDKKPASKTPVYEKVTVKKGDEEYEINVDIVNDKTYINDELVTTDTPKELLDLLKDALPKAIKNQKENKTVNEEVSSMKAPAPFVTYKDFKKWLANDFIGKLNDTLKIVINKKTFHSPHEAISAYEEDVIMEAMEVDEQNSEFRKWKRSIHDQVVESTSLLDIFQDAMESAPVGKRPGVLRSIAIKTIRDAVDEIMREM